MGQYKSVLVFGQPTYPDVKDDDFVTYDDGRSIGGSLSVKYSFGDCEEWHGFLVTDESTMYESETSTVDIRLLLDGGTPLAERFARCRDAWEQLRKEMKKLDVELPEGRLLMVNDYECA
jgi:hypothetical protein